MKSARTGTCSNCGCGFWAFNERGPIPRECDKCTLQRRRYLGKKRAQKRRERKTTPPSKRRGGGSIDKGTEMITSPMALVKYPKSIDRVSRGREGAATRPIAIEPLPDLEILAQHNRKLYDRVIGELRALNAAFGETPEPVIHGGYMRKKSR